MNRKLLLLFKKIREIQNRVLHYQLDNTKPYHINNVGSSLIDVGYVDHITYIDGETSNSIITGVYNEFDLPTGVYTPPKKHVEIFYKQNMNLCWKRMTACKELCHSTIQEKSQKVNTKESLLQLVTELLQPVEEWGVHTTDAVISERVAFYMASEILVPYNDRKKIIQSNKLTFQQIAELFKVPLDIINMLFDDSLMELARDANERLDNGEY